VVFTWIVRIMRIRFYRGFLVLLFLNTSAAASNHYTEKQIDALETRVGKVFWILPIDERVPAFLTSPAADAPAFPAAANESFEITSLVGRKAKNPYYKVRFESGKEGYIHAQAFLEQFNGTIVTVDPLADEKKALAEKNEQEKARLEWIDHQPWSAAVKQSAIKRQGVPGMTAAEAKKVLGDPRRVTRLRGPQQASEEHWFYPDGMVLIFRNGALNRIDTTKKLER
jgi:hypothetical protein